jgi:hypothetical protein
LQQHAHDAHPKLLLNQRLSLKWHNKDNQCNNSNLNYQRLVLVLVPAVNLP